MCTAGPAERGGARQQNIAQDLTTVRANASGRYEAALAPQVSGCYEINAFTLMVTGEQLCCCMTLFCLAGQAAACTRFFLSGHPAALAALLLSVQPLCCCQLVMAS